MKFICYIKKNKLIINLFIYLLIIFLLTNSKIIIPSVLDSVDIFFKKLIPALFPYLLLTELLIHSGVIKNLSYGMSNILSKTFHIPINSTPCVIIGFLLGYPNSAKYILKLYNENKITSSVASRLVFFTSNANISYIVATIGISMFKSVSVGIILLISHFLSAVLIGLFFTSSSNNSIIQQSTTNSNSFDKIYSPFELLSTSILRHIKNFRLHLFLYHNILAYTRLDC